MSIQVKKQKLIFKFVNWPDGKTFLFIWRRNFPIFGGIYFKPKQYFPINNGMAILGAMSDGQMISIKE